MKRWLIVLGVVTVVSVLALVPRWDSLFTTPGVTPENFARLHQGRSQEEVQAILGKPTTTGSASTTGRWWVWEGDGCAIGIHFHAGTATAGALVHEDGSESLLARR